ncbi:uncharacterized protein LOC114250613 [Bombyx mandarina]|uniref:Uncharacterized protein LOC114250613 n=1 Tax=Bombyx mandarina TaxID=7092 RepID=A0A6J2KFI8_BOMMA|nr:uncharacterized protein LOC114250613 [Bombyx mandarina]
MSKLNTISLCDKGTTGMRDLSHIHNDESQPSAQFQFGASTSQNKHTRSASIPAERIISEPTSVAKESRLEIEGSVLSSSSESSRSGVSVASGYTRRLSAFRTSLAPRLREPALVDEIPEQARRSTVSLRVVTLGMEDSVAAVAPSPSSTRSQKSLR